MSEPKTLGFMDLMQDKDKVLKVGGALAGMVQSDGWAYFVGFLQTAATTAAQDAIRSRGKNTTLEYAEAIDDVVRGILAEVESIIIAAKQEENAREGAGLEVRGLRLGGGSTAL